MVMQPTGLRRERGKRTNGSVRRRAKQREKMAKWGEQGISVGSVNMAGASLFKIFLLLEL